MPPAQSAFGTSRTADKLERAKASGLSNAVAVGGDPQAMVAAVMEWTHGRGVDVIIDLVGGAYLGPNLNALASQGRLVLVGTTAGGKATLDYHVAMAKRLTIMGTICAVVRWKKKPRPPDCFLNKCVPLLAAGTVRPVIDRVYKMEEIRDAHVRMEANESFGKIVLVM